jgi:serine/threonine-protein kinase ATR
VSQSFQVTLPSPSTIGEFWPESQQFVALPHELQRAISSQVAAIYIGFVLLSSLVSGTRQRKGHYTGSAAFEHLQLWIVDTCLVLWQHFKRWTTGSDKRLFHDETLSVYLDVLQAVALPIGGSDYWLSVSAKSVQGLVRGLSSVLEKPNVSILNQLHLATLLVRLRSMFNDMPDTASTSGRRRSKPSSVIVDGLEASVALLCHDREGFCDLQKDLQVCNKLPPLIDEANSCQSALCLWTSSNAWPAEVADVRRELCVDNPGAFSDLQIPEDASSVMKAFRALNLGEDGDRPPKRRKTLPESSEHNPRPCYKHLKEVLKTPSQESPDLTGLHNVIL